MPHLLPVNRGILATCYAKLQKEASLQEIRQAYEEQYGDETFIGCCRRAAWRILRMCATPITAIFPCTWTAHQHFIAISAIDNMVKGAAGQAIQNMNLAFGLDETCGLMLTPPAF